MEELTLALMTHSGEARSYTMEAIAAVKQNNAAEAYDRLQKADESLGYAHLSRSALMESERVDTESRISLLLLHAQDHLMTTIVLKDIANELVDLYLKIN